MSGPAIGMKSAVSEGARSQGADSNRADLTQSLGTSHTTWHHYDQNGANPFSSALAKSNPGAAMRHAELVTNASEQYAFLGSQNPVEALINHQLEAGVASRSPGAAMRHAETEINARGQSPFLGAQDPLAHVINRQLDLVTSKLGPVVALAKSLDRLEALGLYDSKAAPEKKFDGMVAFLEQASEIGTKILDLSPEERKGFIEKTEAVIDYTKALQGLGGKAVSGSNTAG